MNRRLVLGTLVATGVLSMTAAAMQQAPAAPRVVEVEKLKDNFYVMRGGGGNSGVFITATGVIVVDTKNPGWGQPLLDTIKTVTDKPITTVINTHTHGDHVSGNVEFPANIEFVTHVNTAANMKKMAPPAGATVSIFAQHNGHGLPKRTFSDRLMLGAGNDRIELHYFGRGHTNGDAWVLFPALRIVHAGDIFAAKGLPNVDANNGGSAAEYGATLSKAAAAFGNVDTVVTGHSTVMTLADLKEYAQFNEDFRQVVEAGKKAGQSAEAIAKAWTLPAKYAGYQAPPARVTTNVQIAYDEVR